MLKKAFFLLFINSKKVDDFLIEVVHSKILGKDNKAKQLYKDYGIVEKTFWLKHI